MPADVASVFEERTVETAGQPLRYLEAGTGPALVYLHGGGGVRPTRAHELLAEKFRVVLLEQPGFGTEPLADELNSLPAYARAVHAAAAAIAGAPFDLIGTSFGSRVAMSIAAQFPESVQALVLLSPTVFTPPGFQLPAPGRNIAIPPLLAHPERSPDGAEPSGPTPEQAALVRAFVEPRAPDLEAALAALEVLTLVAFGTDDQLMPAALGPRYVEANPGIFLTYFFDCGHLIEQERPEAVANLLGDFFTYREKYHVGRKDSLLFP
jgi:pimeloyl-ACP methyl ester carboxylesterase